MKPKLWALPTALLALLMVALSAGAYSAYQTGILKFDKGDYKGALPFFAQAYRQKPKDADTLYYYAVTLEHCGKNKEATDIFKRIYTMFPDTPYSVYAKQALTGGNSAAGKPGDGIWADWSDGAQGPFMYASALIGYQRQGGKRIASAQFDSYPGFVELDPNSNRNVIGTAELKTLAPNHKPEGNRVKFDRLIMGKFTKADAVFDIDPSHTGPATLGRSIWEGYDTKFDEGSQMLCLSRYSEARQLASKAAKGEYFEVPYYLQDGEIFIDVDFGQGNRQRLHYKRNASDIVTFTKNQFSAINPECEMIGQEEQTIKDGDPNLPAAPLMMDIKQSLLLKEVRVGPIVRFKVPAKIIDKSLVRYQALPVDDMPYPELGEAMFAGWEVKWDSPRRILKILKRNNVSGVAG